MRQDILYGPIKTWLEQRGFRVLVTGKRPILVIPISDLVPMAYKVPDLVGINQNKKVVIIEVEKDRKQFFDAFGTCLLWKCVATRVYLAYPKDEILRAPLLKKFGIGLLEVDTEPQSVNEVVTLPQDDYGLDMHGVLELHPTDFKREMDLADHIQRVLE